jgi:hypothetical protein
MLSLAVAAFFALQQLVDPASGTVSAGLDTQHLLLDTQAGQYVLQVGHNCADIGPGKVAYWQVAGVDGQLVLAPYDPATDQPKTSAVSDDGGLVSLLCSVAIESYTSLDEP